MVKSSLRAGNFNLKGKRTAVLSCGCCDAINLKDKELRKIHDKEMEDAKRDFQDGYYGRDGD